MKARPSDSDGRVFVSALYIYPVKSLPGFSVPEARCGPRGLAYDRRFMLVDEAGYFITQRERPELSLLSVRVAKGKLRIAGPHRPTPLVVPLEPKGEGAAMQVQVWSDFLDARVVDDGGFFSDFLGKKTLLVYMPDSVWRRADQRYSGEGNFNSFADGFPILVLSDASISEVSRRVGTEMPVTRYRPNLVVGGLAPFEEDEPAEFRIGRVRLKGVHPCARCAIVDIDPQTGKPDRKVLKVLATFRKRDNGVYLGQNALVASTGRLRVGAEVCVTRG